MQFLSKTILLALVLLSSNVFAELKIAIINVQQALVESEAAQRYNVDIEKKLAPKIKELQKIEGEAKKLQDDFNKNGEKMAQNEREKIDLEFKQKVRDIQALSQEINVQKQKSDNEALQKLKPNLDKAVDIVIKQGNYDLVIDANAIIHLGNDALNITKQVTEQMNKLK